MHDKFYTNPELAILLINKTKTLIDFNTMDILLEPSAGSGNFYFNLDSQKRVGLDLYPDEGIPEIICQDFLSYNPELNKKYLTIGNPPFGRVSSLAVKFFNHASRFSDYVCFIVPRTFKRISIQNRLNPYFHLVYEVDIPPNSFEPKMDVKCVYQVWERKDYERSKIILNIKTSDFYFLKINESQQADFAILAYGHKCGRIVTDIPTTGLRSWHFIKCIKPVNEVIDKLNKLDYSICEDTARQNSIGMAEVCELYNKG